MTIEELVNIFVSSTMNTISASLVKQVECDVYNSIEQISSRTRECDKYMELMDKNFLQYQQRLKSKNILGLNLFDSTNKIIEKINKRRDFKKVFAGISDYFSYAYKDVDFPIDLGTYYSFAYSFIEKCNKMSDVKLINYTSNMKAIDRLIPSDDKVISEIWSKKEQQEKQESKEIQNFCDMVVKEVVGFLKKNKIIKLNR